MVDDQQVIRVAIRGAELTDAKVERADHVGVSPIMMRRYYKLSPMDT